MEGANNTTAVEAPVPSQGLDPAILTPNRNATYDTERRSRMENWLSEPTSLLVAEEADAPVEGDAPADDPFVTPESGEPTAAVDSEATLDGEAPTQQGAAVDPVTDKPTVDPGKPKGFAVFQGEDEVEVPDLVLSYKADGAERKRTLDEIVHFAQLGENYDRRSRELAIRQRDVEDAHSQTLSQFQEQMNTAWAEFTGLVQRLHEDEDFREEYLEEYARLQENPEEIQMRLKAQKADEYERQVQANQERQTADWNRQVWSTVDTIIGENLADFDPESRDAMASRVRNRFYEEYTRRGGDALRESFLADLVREERSVIDKAVARARKDVVERELPPAVAKAKAQAVIESKNKTTQQSLDRDRIARMTPQPGPSAMTTAAPRKFTSLHDASRALKDWAES
jgi:hypothetical protein